MTPQDVVDNIKQSRSQGRGGAGFPTGLTMGIAQMVRSDIKYVVCNADKETQAHLWTGVCLKAIPTVSLRQ